MHALAGARIRAPSARRAMSKLSEVFGLSESTANGGVQSLGPQMWMPQDDRQ